MDKNLNAPIINESFSRSEQAIDRIARQLPHLPRQEVVITRLYYHVLGYLSDYFNAELKQHGLNETIWMALMVLYTRDNETIFPSDLSEALSFSRTNATRVVDDLVEQGWVERIPCPVDRRKTRLALTDAGREFINGILPERHRQMRTLWDEFSADEKDGMEQLLRKLLARLGG